MHSPFSFPLDKVVSMSGSHAWMPGLLTLLGAELLISLDFYGKERNCETFNPLCFGFLVKSSHLQHQNIFSFCKSQQLPPLLMKLLFSAYRALSCCYRLEHSCPTPLGECLLPVLHLFCFQNTTLCTSHVETEATCI